MPDYNATAQVYRHEAKGGRHQYIAPPQPIRSGPVAECMKWVVAKGNDYPETYFMTVPLEAGFIKSELTYRDIEAISKRPDFPQ